MTRINTILASAVFVMLAIAPAAFSQTPDGQTPAEETICDPLKDATPGLYGLCVAYCEAHDAELLSPYGDPNELNTPNQKILENYNRKKQESDPAMPCVLQEGPPGECPCWTAEQLEYMMPPTANYENPACSSDPIMVENLEYGSEGPGFQLTLAIFPYEEYCAVAKFGDYDAGPPAGYSFGLSPEEEQSCATLLTDHAKKYMSPGVVWDCFD